MQRIFTYLIFVSLFYACTNRSEKSAGKATDKKVAETVSATNGDTSTNVQFKQFWEQFKVAVKKNDITAINKLTYFPIHNLYPCYLPTQGQTRATDTAGLSSADFKKLSKKVFDDETSWLTSTPADSLYLYSKQEDDKNLPLETIVDSKTPVYTYAVVYSQGETGGNKSLYFGRVKDTYKLIWIECDGNITGHTH
jgi:hypothetical protein